MPFSREVRTMAKQLLLLDDFTGEPGAQTVNFSILDRSYECELGDNSLLELEAVLDKFIEVARDLTPPRYASNRRASVDQALVRVWAGENNLQVSPKGRVPGWIIDRYMADQQRLAAEEAARIEELTANAEATEEAEMDASAEARADEPVNVDVRAEAASDEATTKRSRRSLAPVAS